MRVFVLNDFAADQLRAMLCEAGERVVDVIHGEHDAEVAEGVHGSVAMVVDRRRREESLELEPAVAVRRAHHGDLDAHRVQPGHSLCPVSIDGGSSFELKAELGEEGDRNFEDSTTMPTLSIR